MQTKESRLAKSLIEKIVATSARMLVSRGKLEAASVVANAIHNLAYSHSDNWDEGTDYWTLRFSIPVEVYGRLEDRSGMEYEIDLVISEVMQAIPNPDPIRSKIVSLFSQEPDWRDRINIQLSGEGITNQGRARSGNIAAREHKGLLFRSLPEAHFYDALWALGVPFAPLSVVVCRTALPKSRIEPDFVIYKDGLFTIVEIDGDLYHSETPVAAHARLKFLLDEGAVVERVEAAECDTPTKARAAAEKILATIDKRRRRRL